MPDFEPYRADFERLSKCSWGFKRSRKGNYVNPATARDWKWFCLGLISAWEHVEPIYWYAECADPDYSRLYHHEGDAKAQISDHGGGIVTALYTHPALQAEPSRAKARAARAGEKPDARA